jgi:hypothetical protein
MRPEDVLRQAFEARAGQVEVAPDALPTIRARINARRTQRRRALVSLASLATTAAATVIALAVGFTSCLPADRGHQPPGASSTPPGPTGSATPSTSPPTTVRAPVYFIGTVRGRPVLYWEYHQVPVGDGSLATRIQGALTVMLSGAAADPDYASAWPAGAAVRGVTVASDAIVVDLSGATVNGADPATATAAVQQLIYTATGVAADQGTTRPGVRLLFDGAPLTTLWGSVPVAGTLARGPQGETLAEVWLVSPQEGNVVNRSFEVHINGSVFEATVRLRVRNAAGAVVSDEPYTLSIGAPNRGDIKIPMTLEPGLYTLEAFYVSVNDSSEQALDGHRITVRPG